jgi:hypothetical protein
LGDCLGMAVTVRALSFCVLSGSVSGPFDGWVLVMGLGLAADLTDESAPSRDIKGVQHLINSTPIGAV